MPQSNWGDLNGQINALDLGERRLHALLDEYGDDTIASALAALSQRAEVLMRTNIAALPDGTYSYDDFLDNDGIVDRPLRIALDLTIAGDRMTCDFSRSAPPCDGQVNIARATAVASCYVALKHIFTDVPANAGCLAPIEFIIPDTTLLGVSAPRPVAGYTETILRVIDVIFGAFAKAALPDSLPEARRDADEALLLTRSNGLLCEEVLARLASGVLHEFAGDTEAALGDVRYALDLGRAVLSGDPLCRTHYITSRVQVFAGKIDETLTHIGEARNLVPPDSLLGTIAEIVEGLLALSRLDTGEARADCARFDLAALVATTAVR